MRFLLCLNVCWGILGVEVDLIKRKDARKIIDELLCYDLSKGREIGTWYKFHNHVYGVALLCEKIAKKIGLNSRRAYIFGLLHDAGKIEETYVNRYHGIIGYEKFKDIDKELAGVCITHSFYNNVIPDDNEFDRYFFKNEKDREFVRAYLLNNVVSEYERLVQLCDCLVNCNGLVKFEDRVEEFEKRYKMKVPDHMYKGGTELKKYFDDKLGIDVYELYDEICSDYMIKEGKDKK